MFGCPGTEQSLSTLTARSSPHRPEAIRRPDARQCRHTRGYCSNSIRSVPAVSPRPSISLTGAPVRTSTPSFSNVVCAYFDRLSGKAESRRGPASKRIMRADVGSIWRKSRASVERESSAMVPANSTPVGPPPTTMKVSARPVFFELGVALRPFKCAEQALPDRQRVGERFQDGGIPPPRSLPKKL